MFSIGRERERERERREIVKDGAPVFSALTLHWLLPYEPNPRVFKYLNQFEKTNRNERNVFIL